MPMPMPMPIPIPTPINALQLNAFVCFQQKNELLEAVSYTSKGKTASPEQQERVLKLVRRLETDFPPSPELLLNPKEAQVLDGTWYLQYTSPSTVGDVEESSDAWKPVAANEGDSNIETRQFEARGTVSAAGITVDTSNRPVKQIIDVEESRVLNDVALDWGRAQAGGKFRPSPNVPNRALVSFDTAKIDVDNIGLSLDLGFIFPLLSKLRGSKENGWLETTFVDKDLRIGRGNKGTMFVLTRDPEAVKP